MTYEVIQVSQDDWRAEAISLDGDGEVYVASFSGPDAEKLAKEYAAWKNVGVAQN